MVARRYDDDSWEEVRASNGRGAGTWCRLLDVLSYTSPILSMNHDLYHHLSVGVCAITYNLCMIQKRFFWKTLSELGVKLRLGVAFTYSRVDTQHKRLVKPDSLRVGDSLVYTVENLLGICLY
jgi:hypothetical protein